VIALNQLTNQTKEDQEGLTLIFLHGNSLGASLWYQQISDTRFDTYPCVAFDLPGHGASPRLDNYQIPNLVPILADNINKFGRCVVVGHSLGGHLVLQCLDRLKHCEGLMLVGTPPLQRPLNMGEAFAADERLGLLFKEALSEDERKEIIKFIGCESSIDLAENALQSTDPKFRAGIAQSVANEELIDEIEAIEKINYPVAIVVGEKDATINMDYIESLSFPTLWKTKSIVIPNLRHTPQMENPDTFNLLLEEFVRSID